MDVTGPEVLIGRGCLEGEVLPARAGRRRVAVLTQPGALETATRLADRLTEGGLITGLITAPDGEAAKTMTIAETTFREFNRLGLTRHDTVLAVGGGALTDLSGFVAATYLRGIEAVYCPTTLLGAVDAAIGGKTAVNVGGKNLVGVFSHPTRVLIDIDILEALPATIRRQGMSEALKAGLIGDVELVDLLERDGLSSDLEEVVGRAVSVKTAIVEDDFRESGRRAFLNYGHTIGHAVEVVAGLSHGEAVAVGMVAAGRASTLRASFTEEDRVRTIIEGLGLPVRLDGDLDAAQVLELVWLDKKRDASGVRMVLLEAIGQPVLETADPALIDEALAAVAPPS